jgi:hypothetical protein
MAPVAIAVTCHPGQAERRLDSLYLAGIDPLLGIRE